MIHGIDVSNWQSERFPLELSDGTPVDFVIIQVTRGMTAINEKWREQAAWARENGLAVGFYHFGKPGEDAGAQARRFSAELTALYPGETLWYDWETSTGGTPTNAEKDAFIRELKRLRPGRKVGLYCNVDFWLNRDTTSYYGDALWIASWSTPVADPNIMAAWTIHQYADGPGVDHNRARFDSREDMKVWGGKPEDPTLALLRGVAHVVHELGAATLRESVLAAERYDALKAAIDDVRALLSSEPPSPGVVAQAVVDEFQRRLES